MSLPPLLIPFFLSTEKPFFLKVDFGNDLVNLFVGLNISIQPHPTDPSILFLGSVGFGIPICLAWAKGTFERVPPLSPPLPSSRSEFCTYLANLINTA